MSESDIELVESWRSGNEDAACALFARYVDRLLTIVGRQLQESLAPRVTPDDVVQSTFASMFIRTRKGQFQFCEDRDFWKLLVTIALNKVRRQVRYHQRTKRDIRRETATSTEGFYAALADRIRAGSNNEEAIELGCLLEQLYEQLPPRERRLIELRIQHSEATQAELGRRLGVGDRTIRRLNERILEQARELRASAS